MGTVVIAEIREQPLSVDEVIDAVRSAGAGAVVAFLGLVRERDGGRDVTGLDYSAHPDAARRLAEVAQSVADREQGTRVAVTHRVGTLEIGDLAVVLAVATAHRGEAFTLARALIDELKAGVPIWKHQSFADGSNEWVGLP
jgi:molybdopterin synthase catalytic subunit